MLSRTYEYPPSLPHETWKLFIGNFNPIMLVEGSMLENMINCALGILQMDLMLANSKVRYRILIIKRTSHFFGNASRTISHREDIEVTMLLADGNQTHKDSKKGNMGIFITWLIGPTSYKLNLQNKSKDPNVGISLDNEFLSFFYKFIFY